MTKKLADYLNSQLNQRCWSGRELGRRANVTSTSVLRALDPHPEKPAGWEVLFKIAKALRVNPVNLWVLGGLMDREPDQTTRERHLLNTFRQLPEEHQQSLIAFTDFLFTKRSHLFSSFDTNDDG